MHVIAEYEARDLFGVDHVEVKEGIIQAGRRPRNRFFGWTAPAKTGAGSPAGFQGLRRSVPGLV
jgi:hypothetical protein